MRALVFLVLSAICNTSLASGSGCIKRNLSDDFTEADVIFLVTAAESVSNSIEPELTKVILKEYFKGGIHLPRSSNFVSTKKEIQFILQGSQSKIKLKKNRDYVIFGKRSEVHGVITSNLCKYFNVDSAKAQQNIDKLRKLKDAVYNLD